MSAYVEIIVKCTAAIAKQVIDEMLRFIEKETVSKVWSYDIDSSEQAVRAMADPYACFFYKDGLDEIMAELSLAYTPAGEGYDEGRLWVPNIVPKLKNRLEAYEYNDIAKRFVDEIVNPILNKNWPNLKCEISQPEVRCTVEVASTEEEDDDHERNYADFKIGVSRSGKCIRHTNSRLTAMLLL